jgi:hypothetical protein
MRRPKLIGAALIAAMLVGCKTPQQKLSSLVKKYPELIRDSSIIDIDTTIIDIPDIHTDSVIHINTFKSDTIIIQKERLRIQTIYRNDSVFISGDCYGVKDTIVSIEKIPYNYIVNKDKKGFSWQWLLIIGLAGFIVGYINKSKIKVNEQ